MDNIWFYQCKICEEHTDVIRELVVDKNIDVLAITETWLSAGSRDKSIRDELTPIVNEIIDIPRIKAKGGGVSIVCRSSLIYKLFIGTLIKVYIVGTISGQRTWDGQWVYSLW